MWFRRTSLPDDARRALDVPRGEKILATAALADGSWAVATTAELAVVQERPGRVAMRRPWWDVDRAAFDPERSIVTVEWVDAEPDLRLPLTDPERTPFPQVLRERVQWSVVIAEVVGLPGGREVKVAVRRTTSGELFSQAVAGAGVDLEDPTVAHVVDAAEDRLRSAAGL
ncbi:hypothetical protein [Isoptericola variabilis]|uniref:Uncharacterized protein n=1 Tax=Isoptericola variabilis (strain 225) TaxID=743718 RepID=F6FXD7_ISOV2|nr:hypothetical protein [Isoptericola variabilis]AEG44665.1 hypothetical protein Isova_1928 [Isoptericola variabilis 225]TWH33477.1 hypothetical protein L600_001700000560 [Isoptericola variabilis J7]